ncbi:MAG: hypothetical protein ABGZ35_03310 [Planctomycetaceae bacterium]
MTALDREKLFVKPASERERCLALLVLVAEKWNVAIVVGREKSLLVAQTRRNVRNALAEGLPPARPVPAVAKMIAHVVSVGRSSAMHVRPADKCGSSGIWKPSHTRKHTIA